MAKLRDPRLMRFEEFLRARGLRHSSRRSLVIDIFFSTQGRLSADELWRSVRNRDTAIGAATVYRALRLLADAGLARPCEGEGTGGAAQYEPVGAGRRDQLLCVDCGKTVDLDLPEADLLHERVALRHGYSVEHRELQMFGHCPACRRKRALARRRLAKRS